MHIKPLFHLLVYVVILLLTTLLMAAEGDEFEDCISYYDHLMGHIGWEDLGKVLCGGVTAVGDIDGKAELADAAALGASIE